METVEKYAIFWENCKFYGEIVGMQNFQDIFETRWWSFISAFSICMTVPLSWFFSFVWDWGGKG